ncbi:hypothetical protein ACS0TY_020997 [Phlomoides rotata]
MQCDIALSCWDISDFREKLESLVLHVDSLPELFLRMFSELDKESASSFLMVGRRLWKMRNDVVWEGKKSTAYKVVSDATVFLQEWMSDCSIGGPASPGRTPASGGQFTASSVQISVVGGYGELFYSLFSLAFAGSRSCEI